MFREHGWLTELSLLFLAASFGTTTTRVRGGTIVVCVCVRVYLISLSLSLSLSLPLALSLSLFLCIYTLLHAPLERCGLRLALIPPRSSAVVTVQLTCTAHSTGAGRVYAAAGRGSNLNVLPYYFHARLVAALLERSTVYFYVLVCGSICPLFSSSGMFYHAS